MISKALFILCSGYLFAIFLRDNPIALVSNPADISATPPVRAHHALVYDENTKTIMMTGGSTTVDSGRNYIFYNDVWNLNSSGWKKSGLAGDERSGFRLAFDTRRKKIFSFGGYANGNSLSDLRIYENNIWKTITDIPEMKTAEPGFVYDEARDRLITFGGSVSRGIANPFTWEWNGKSWKKFEGSGPAARQAFVMVYDSKRKKTVLFGGMGPTPETGFNDTWEFDGNTWTKVDDKGPGPRQSPGFAYDSKRGLLIMFGGIVDQKMTGDTWSWNGFEWKKLADSGPSPRVMGYMEYDKNRDRIVLFGGRPGWPNDVGDTWEWDGKQWSEVR